MFWSGCLFSDAESNFFYFIMVKTLLGTESIENGNYCRYINIAFLLPFDYTKHSRVALNKEKKFSCFSFKTAGLFQPNS
jgi:hypothetical protein